LDASLWVAVTSPTVAPVSGHHAQSTSDIDRSKPLPQLRLQSGLARHRQPGSQASQLLRLRYIEPGKPVLRYEWENPTRRPFSASSSAAQPSRPSHDERSAKRQALYVLTPPQATHRHRSSEIPGSSTPEAAPIARWPISTRTLLCHAGLGGEIVLPSARGPRGAEGAEVGGRPACRGKPPAFLPALSGVLTEAGAPGDRAVGNPRWFTQGEKWRCERSDPILQELGPLAKRTVRLWQSAPAELA